MFIQVLLVFSLLISASTTEASSVQDFCVADTSLPNGPSGYSCKDPAQVVADDFVYRLGEKPNTTSDLFRVSVAFAFAPDFAGINGLGIGCARLEMRLDGVVPFHTHRATEIIYVTEGKISAGFVSADANKVYIKTLRVGDFMVFPLGMLHFQINIGKDRAVFIACLNSDNPGFQTTSLALFGNNLPISTVVKTTLIRYLEVKRLKALFGGGN